MTTETRIGWEYQTLVRRVKPKDILGDPAEAEAVTALLTRHGNEGWELVGAVPVAIGSFAGMNSETQGFAFFLKRRSLPER